MTPIDRIYRIHERMRKVYGLDQGDDRWDAYYKGTPVKILTCNTLHWNGKNQKGKDVLTKGRFYINYNTHKDLEKEKGLYLFCIYRFINGLVILADNRIVPVRYISPLLGKGKNTKLAYGKVFNLPTGKG